MAGKSEYRVVAREMFVEQGQSLRQVSEVLPVSYNTLARWADEEEWRSQRIEYVRSLDTPYEKMVRILQKKIEELAGLNVADIDHTMVLAVKRLSDTVQDMRKKMDMPTAAAKIMPEFVSFVKRQYPDIAETILDQGVLDEFFEHIWSEK